MAPIPVRHSGKRDRSNGSCQIHLNHAAVNDKHDTDGKGVHGKSHKKGLEPQPEQFSRAIFSSVRKKDYPHAAAFIVVAIAAAFMTASALDMLPPAIAEIFA